MSRFRTSGRPIFDILVDEHKFVRATYDQFKQRSQSVSTAEDNQALLQLGFMFIRDVSCHSHKEEILLYPLLSKLQLTSEKHQQAQPQSACNEHILVEKMLSQMEMELESSMKTGKAVGKETMQLFDEIMKNLAEHIEEEEQVLLPSLQQQLSEEDVIRLGREWEALNGRVATRPHPELPTLGALAAAANAAQAPLDVLQDEARFKHVMPTAAGSLTADALTQYEQQKLDLAAPTQGAQFNPQLFHQAPTGPSALADGSQPIQESVPVSTSAAALQTGASVDAGIGQYPKDVDVVGGLTRASGEKQDVDM